MRLALLAAALCFAAGASAERNVNPNDPSEQIRAQLRFRAPEGWKPVAYANAGGADPVLRYEDASDAIQIRVFGAPGSDYATPKAFLAGPAGSERGAAPVSAGFASVAGGKRALYRRGFPIATPDPHGPSSPVALQGRETFLVLPLEGRRFAVLSYRRSSPIPDPRERGEKAWAAFLKTVEPRARLAK